MAAAPVPAQANSPGIPMPARGERAAPTFDQSKPQELPRFFDELEYLFNRAGITADSEKKKQLLRYVAFEIEQIWKALPEFKSVTNTYDDFKNAVLAFYPDATGEFIYSLRDMDLLIGERQRLGISSPSELSAYHLQFMAITSWLIDKEQLGDLEQQRAYVRAFQPQLLTAINNRLQLKQPDHHPSVPYKVQDVYNAARFVLQGSTQTFYNQVTAVTNPPLSQPNIVTTAEPAIKKEDLASFFTEFTKTIVGVLNQNQGQNNRQSSNSYGRTLSCLGCDGAHLISNCPEIQEYIKAGKCRRNTEGKVVLPSGAWIPREIPGKNIIERIDEWHRRNPNQLATASLFNAVSTRLVEQETLFQPNNVTYQLSSKDRIATLQAELYHLKNRKAAAGMRTRAQRSKDTIEEEEDEDDVAAARAASKSAIEEVPAGPTTKTATQPTTVQQPTEIPEHPYRNARDAAYIPATSKPAANVPVNPQGGQKKQEPAYKTLPPIHDAKIAAEVYQRSMEAPITITQRELLSLSPEVRSQVRDSTTTKRIQNKDATTTPAMFNIDDDEYDYDEYHLTIPTIPTFAVPNASHRVPPTGATVIPDEYEAYYRSLRPGEEPDPDRIIVAIDNVPIRSIHALIDNSMKKECILDPGCQIIAMSEQACHEIGIAYDPTIRINMQSANGEVNPSLGLARNVPFRIGNITFYLQVHVIHTPAYDVLLGRPFDTLTSSIVRNFTNEDQTITIRDPNTGQRVTVPTFSKAPICRHKKQDF